MIWNRLKMSIKESRELEDTIAKVAKEQADIDYIAMMCDIDLEEDENDEQEI